MKTLVIQSSPEPASPWIRLCLDSVAAWAAEQGHAYRFIGDEIFTLVPAWYMEKAGTRRQIATDYARLVLASKALQEDGVDRVVWLDADVLVIDGQLNIDFDGPCAFGQEWWIQHGDKGRLQARMNVHNAITVFHAGCPVLPFLQHTVLSLMERVDPAHIVPQFAGPKLLNALHPLANFALLPQVGALSPLVLTDVLAGGGQALDLLRARTPVAVQALNLCASLLEEQQALALVQVLLDRPGLISSES